ncbi:hypothetical protein [Catenuloplanes atrovinosus]|uniref:DNA-binding response OmpR family regulator n=1 Tax=Catenuloplanes atrovinosus TaxID=137266 RepID=A0AAE3YLP8_9ACTN|nr:hypothetical protein [Catenuloplanes atrovinosus]MDR7274817.1 DNA-binding response OmpR family regulator [Catenuloplanes atrovinosus]
MVSAAVAPNDIAAGAGDYLIKPFSPRFPRARLTGSPLSRA